MREQFWEAGILGRKGKGEGVDSSKTITSCTASSSAEPGTIEDTRVARRSFKFSEEDWKPINMNMVIEMDGDMNIQINNG